MAILTPSALISDIRGSIGGANFYTSKHGIVLRRKANRKRSYSSGTANTQSAWSQAVGYAKSVAKSDMDGIITEFARSMSFSKNGHNYNLTPFSYIVSLNALRIKLGLSPALPSGQPRGRLDIPTWDWYFSSSTDIVRITWDSVLPANVYFIGSMSHALDGPSAGKPQRFPHYKKVLPGTTSYASFYPPRGDGIITVYVYFRFIDATGNWTPLIWGKGTNA